MNERKMNKKELEFILQQGREQYIKFKEYFDKEKLGNYLRRKCLSNLIPVKNIQKVSE